MKTEETNVLKALFAGLDVDRNLGEPLSYFQQTYYRGALVGVVVAFIVAGDDFQSALAKARGFFPANLAENWQSILPNNWDETLDNSG